MKRQNDSELNQDIKKQKLEIPTSFWVEKLRKTDGTPLLWDVTLRVDKHDKPYYAHRNVLAASSMFFARKFESWSEDETKTAEVIFSEKEVSHQGLGRVLNILYDGQTDLSFESVWDIHATSDFLAIEPIAKKCLNFMTADISDENVVSLWQYSKKVFSGSKDLAGMCMEYVGDNLSDFILQDDVMGLAWEDISQFLSFASVAKTNGDTWFDFALSWINYDWAHRYAWAEKAVQLMEWIRLEYWTLHQCDSVKGLRTRQLESDGEKVAAYHLLRKLTREADDEAGEVTDGSMVYCIKKQRTGGVAGYVCRRFDPLARTWAKETPLAFPESTRRPKILTGFKMRQCACVIVGAERNVTVHVFEPERVFPPFACLDLPNGVDLNSVEHTFACGENGWVCIVEFKTDGFAEKLFTFDLSGCMMSKSGSPAVVNAHVTEDLSSKVGSQLSKFSVSVVADDLIFYGGHHIRSQGSCQASFGTTILSLRGATEWSMGPNMLYLADEPTGYARGSVLYVSGGIFRQSALPSVCRLDFRTWKWTALCPMLVPRHGHHLTTYNGNLVAFSQKSAITDADVEAYDDADHLVLDLLSEGWNVDAQFANVDADFVVSI